MNARRGTPTTVTSLELLERFDLARMRLPMLRATAPVEGPRLFLTAGVHGDEVTSVVVIHEVFRRLRREPLRCGELRAFPVVNPAGLAIRSRRIPFSDEDLNRSFPGHEEGSLAERIAHRLLKEILDGPPQLVVDMHTDWRRSIPYVILDSHVGREHHEAWEAAQEAALSTGLPVVRDSPHHSPSSDGSLSQALIRKNVPAITLELGESELIDEREVERGVSVIWNLLASREMVAPRERYRSELPRGYADTVLRYREDPRAPCNGIVRFRRHPGQLVQPGQVVARVFSASGRVLSLCRSNTTGLILGHQECAVTFQGQPLLALGELAV